MNQTTGNSDVDIMSLLSHELSTPLTTIRWYSELLKMGKMTTPLDTEQAKMVDEILMATDRMSELVNDVHESSWLERDKYADEPAPTSLAELIAQVQSEQQADIATKSLQFAVDTDPLLPPIVARPSTLLLIVHNLLSNAVKYTPLEGSVQVTLRLATDAEAAKINAPHDQNFLYLSVSDTGYGIPASQQDHVFQKLFRADNVRALDINGTGLGLYIVSLAVAKLGGVVWFESTEQKGSNFFVVLPLQRAA
jgi:signal transduction histidine kinase